ncbi:spore germination protein GerPE [Desertibacillus haloalkaliphilus]|uniref:spore germination protein GerPE n=1 Tax=Desertibacillus haloalkaliphilus TaxID=1328930 RepID=UPI001C27833D|nr:spore germination protein GerPE [Desertibacillus haloalkaliphilus]MBU8907909.1 spore germination protein GerPE [Desertibacillus haloalkaliphilus]
MLKRISKVNDIKITDVSISSVFQVGDADHLVPRSRALAVQREFEYFYGDEGNFDLFPIFTMELPHLPVSEPVNVQRRNESAFIKVNSIKITSVAASGITQIGSNRGIDADVRVKHIRQLLDGQRQDV